MQQTRHRQNQQPVPAAAHSPPAPALLRVPRELSPMVLGSLEPQPLLQQGGFWTKFSPSTYKARNHLCCASPTPALCWETPGARCPQPLGTEPHGPSCRAPALPQLCCLFVSPGTC